MFLPLSLNQLLFSLSFPVEHFPVTHAPLSPLHSPSPAFMSEATVPSISARDREMLALACTPQLGPTRVRRLFERIARVEDIFRPSLTELEATGLPAASAQSIALGDSLRLADVELKASQSPRRLARDHGLRPLPRASCGDLRSSPRPLCPRRR